MEQTTLSLSGLDLPVYALDALVIGSGCAGFNAADRLWPLGQHDIVLVTENRAGGTSRNTGSDKQTYYKLPPSGGDPDSAREKDQTLSALTARFNLSRSYLSDRLHRAVHSNLTDYVTLTRIQCAANLLRYHHYTITQAAQEVGIPVIPYLPVQAHHRRDAVPLRPVESHRGLRDEPAKKKNFAAALIWPPCNPL